MGLPYYEVWKINLREHTDRHVATFKSLKDAEEYAEEFLRGDFINYVIKGFDLP